MQLVVAGRHDPIADAVRSVATELVANVVQHTASKRGLLRAWNERPGSPFRLEVEDDDPTAPLFAAAMTNAPPATGLRLVTDLADRCGVQPTDRGGKLVWAEWDRSARR